MLKEKLQKKMLEGVRIANEKKKKKEEEKKNKPMTANDIQAKLKAALDAKVLQSVMDMMKKREEEKKL